MSIQPVKVGVVGCGAISSAYLKANKTFDIIDVVALADLMPERAAAKAQEFGIPRVCKTVDELLNDDSIEIVLNLTIPKAHAEVNAKAIAAGRNVHVEKPFGINRKEGMATLAAAKDKGVRVGSAPDTFFGGGHQTCRKLIDDGWIGQPVAATAFMLCHGHESWHPDPEFYYEVGGGPMLDMGPYYLTALVNLMGPIRRISGSARVTFPERTITSEKKRGKKVKVETPTHIAGVMDFASGAVGTIITSFDVWGHSLPRIEIYGTEGTLFVPDPNGFGGPVFVQRAGGEKLQVPLTHGYAENSRGIGAADMACGLRSGRPHRCSSELAMHVLDAMQSFLDASDTGKAIELTTTCDRPAPLPLGLANGELDL